MPFRKKSSVAAKRWWAKFKLAKQKLSIPSFPVTQDPTLPESATFNLTEPLLEAIKEEPVPDVPSRQPLNQVLLVIEDPKVELPLPSADPIPEVALFCSLCLRPCISDQVVEFSTELSWNCLDVASGQDKLGLILGLELELERCAICRACWTMVETLAEFSEGCLKAAAWRERFSFGLGEECVALGDGWLLKENVEALERTRKMVQEHVERIEIAEVDARNRQDADMDQLPKVEPLEVDDHEWTEDMSHPDPPEDDKDPKSPEDPPKNETTDDAPEIVDKVEMKVFSCKKCQRKFETKCGMSIHFQFCKNSTQNKTFLKLFTCSICSANFTGYSKLEDHRNRHLGIKPYECRKENCNKRFHAARSRKKHERDCDGNGLQEEPPEDSPQDPPGGEREITVYSCSNCPRKYHKKGGLKRHMEQCNGLEKSSLLYTCSICSMDFTSNHNFDAHMNKHNGIKPYKCNRKSCGQHFYGKYLLYQHKQLCGKDKPVCTLCGAQLSSTSTLKAHMEIHAVPSVGCETCGKKFKSNRALKRHQLVHSDERNHPCSECGKALKTKDALRVHMRIHTQEKPFSCTVCGQGFAYKCLVKPHMKKCLSGED